MLRKSVVWSLAFSVIGFTAMERAHAALSPKKIAELREAATDVLEIEVLEVVVEETKLAKKFVHIEANVVAVKRSSSGTKPGEKIRIGSYYIARGEISSPEELVELIGPKVPPLFERGWKGTVFVKATDSKDDTKTFGLAAFGHSFITAPVKESASDE